MKHHLLSLLCVLFPLSTISAVQAQESLNSSHNTATDSVQHIAGFGGIRIPSVGDSDEDTSETETPSSSGEEVTGFSEEYEPYSDTFNGFAVSIPVEFDLLEPGQTTNWTGPVMDDGAVGIYVNAAPLPGVDSYMLQNTYQQQYEQDRFYTNVELVTVPFGDGTAPALRAEEVTNKRGTNTPKSPDDIHRWHLIVFGNERVYTWGFTGMFQTFEDQEVQSTYETVINSVQLVSIE